jgi:MFS family permease
MLHSLYAFGVLTVVLVSTLFLNLFGTENWMYLTVFLALWPALAAVLFMISPMPDMTSHSQAATPRDTRRRSLVLAMCVGCIFFGSCAENVMSNWISGFMERALHIDKSFGDILGLAVFALLLGMARITYAKIGKRIMPVLLTGMIGAAVCYLTAALATGKLLPLIACILTGLFTAMLWPGTLIMMEEKLPGVGLAAYALMAAGGDLGASVAPQLMGIVVDQVSLSPYAAELGARLGLTAEQVGMKAGMLTSAVFPLLGMLLLLCMALYFKKHRPDTP